MVEEKDRRRVQLRSAGDAVGWHAQSGAMGVVSRVWAQPRPLSSERAALPAQWARNRVVKDGLTRRDRAHGVWEISDAGRRHLASGGA